MNATVTFDRACQPQPLLSGSQRAATASAVVAAVCLAWLGMGSASHTAMDSASAIYSQGRTHVTLSAVHITGHREKKAT